MRTVEREMLDHLPVSDEKAIRSRRDLRRVNFLLGSASILKRRIIQKMDCGTLGRVADLGGGDGEFSLGLARELKESSGLGRWIIVDQRNAIGADLPARYRLAGWELELAELDVFDWLEGMSEVDLIVANLFLHHFQESRLRDLMKAAAERCRVFVSCDPRRTRFGPVACRLLGVLGCNEVTRHDAAVSVRAGFRGRELSALWPSDGRWTVEEGSAGLFSHFFMARR